MQVWLMRQNGLGLLLACLSCLSLLALARRTLLAADPPSDALADKMVASEPSLPRNQSASAAFRRIVRSREEYELYVDDLINGILRRADAYADIPVLSGPYKNAGLTMANKRLLRKLKEQLEDIVDRGVHGDIFETGTWRGGTAIFMVGVLTAYEALRGRGTSHLRRRHFWFFDSFAGFHQGQGLEVGPKMEKQLSNPVYVAPLERVMNSFAAFGLLGETVHFVKGLFQSTMPAFGVPPNPIALLRLDGDLYSSTMVTLRSFYPAVAEGGWVVIDDYDWHPKSPGVCRAAIDEFRRDFSISSPIVRTFGRPSWMRTTQFDGVPHQVDHTHRIASSINRRIDRCAAMHEFAKQYERLRRAHMWEELHCPQPIGYRPKAHVPEHVGSPCEAWIHRGAQYVLSRVLEMSMDALEWSTGSSSRYYLLFVGSLHSIEHDVAWATEVRAALLKDLPLDVLSRWHLDSISNSTPYFSGRGKDESRKAFAAYVGVPLQRASYDFVSVDGRARSACLRRVWRDNLVTPGGLLMLDNSMRPQYAAARRMFDISPNWTSIEFLATGDVSPGLAEVGTTLWCRMR